MKSCGPLEEDSAAQEAGKKGEQLETKRLWEYTIQSHANAPQNNTYTDFERFAHMAEDTGTMGVSEVAEVRHILQGDIEALLSTCNEAEAWYKAGSETAKKQLSQIRYEFRKVESTRRRLQEDTMAVGDGLESVGGKCSRRQGQLDAVGQQLSSELQWLQEGMTSQQPDGASGILSRSVNTEVKQALVEVLHQACGGELCSEAKQTLTAKRQSDRS